MRDQVEAYERSGGAEANTLLDTGLPVIIVTTKDQETDRVWGLRQGAKDYIAKPATEVELVGKIKAVLGAQ